MEKDNSQPASEGYTFNVLHEEVADIDVFEEKTHERISNSLYSLITSTKKACTIGLEGGWGSGKSTVINLLRSKLRTSEQKNSKEKTLFYTFDAWAHDGNALRKTFLEELILSVAKDSNIRPDKLTPKLKDIRERASGRKKTVSTESTKNLSSYAKWLAMSALAVPLGAALLSKVDFNKLYLPWNENASDIHWPLLFCILLITSPLIVTLINVLKSLNNDDYNFTLLNPNHSETLTQNITQDSDRTSLEFEQFFKGIMSHLLSGNNRYGYSKIIVVIDNLDRIDAEHAKSIWITLQTFFQHRSGDVPEEEKNWIDKVWFIVPYDRDGLGKIWNPEPVLPPVILTQKDEFGLQGSHASNFKDTQP